jgi:hypothetical protein
MGDASRAWKDRTDDGPIVARRQGMALRLLFRALIVTGIALEVAACGPVLGAGGDAGSEDGGDEGGEAGLYDYPVPGDYDDASDDAGSSDAGVAYPAEVTTVDASTGAGAGIGFANILLEGGAG